MADLRDVNLNRLWVFVAVVEAGSLTAAAERLGIAKTMVSAHIQRLELEVGASLLTRTTRRLNVTEAGRTFYEASSRILSDVEDALALVSEDGRPLRGVLRVSAPIDYGTLIVAPALVDLGREHAALEVELLCDDRFVDLVADGVDLAIRLGHLADSNLRAVRIGSYTRWIVASPAFVERWGQPETPAALAAMPCVSSLVPPRTHSIALENAQGDTQPVHCRAGGFQADTAPACRAATLAGGGFALLTDFSVADDLAAGRLLRLLPHWSAAPVGIHAVYPPTRRASAKVRVFIDMLKARLLEPR